MKTDFKTKQEVLGFIGLFEKHCQELMKSAFDVMATRRATENHLKTCQKLREYANFVYIYDDGGDDGAAAMVEPIPSMIVEPEFVYNDSGLVAMK